MAVSSDGEACAIRSVSPNVAVSRQRSTILYVGDKTGERGREWTTVTRQADGSRTLRATCEIDDGGVLRDVIYTVDAAWRPTEAFVRVEVRGECIGSGWFRFEGPEAQCEAYTPRQGRLSQRRRHEAPVRGFGSHPLSCDIWFLPAFDLSRPAETQELEDVVVCSTLPDGASSPLLQDLASRFPVRFVGNETITVPAGTFDVHHFQFAWPNRPPQELWCTPGDYSFVKARSNQLSCDYVLVEREG